MTHRRGTLVPGYGFAESTVMVTSAVVGEGPLTLRCDPEALNRGRARPVNPPGGRRLVSCGPVPPSITLVVADSVTSQECEEGQVGEIFVQGPSVGTGYWNRPDEVFHAELPGRRGPFLRTGDTGFRWDSELFVTGRAKEVIIIAGANHHPHDLEATAEAAHPAVLGCCVLAVDDGERERVVVLAEVLGAADEDEPAMALRRSVHSGHGVRMDDIAFVAPGTRAGARVESLRITKRTTTSIGLTSPVASNLQSSKNNPRRCMISMALVGQPLRTRILGGVINEYRCAA